MTATYTLQTIGQLVEVGTKLSLSWFRGHATACNELMPRVYRKEFAPHRQLGQDIEQRIIEHFRRQAPVLSDYVPEDEDPVSWLFLMQHHGAPTRLLDWTSSPLIALYFAVSANPKEDAELWGMYPNSLNKLSGGSGVFLPRDGRVKYLAEEPTSKNRTALARKYALSQRPERPVALYPPVRFQRMAAQLSVFTIHPEPTADNTIPLLLTDERDLFRYIIPAKQKHKLGLDLMALGFPRHALFPDLDALAQSVVDTCNVVGYGRPAPPRWEEDEHSDYAEPAHQQ